MRLGDCKPGRMEPAYRKLEVVFGCISVVLPEFDGADDDDDDPDANPLELLEVERFFFFLFMKRAEGRDGTEEPPT